MRDLSADVLHVIPRLSLGGGSRALIAAAKYSSQSSAFRHSAISLSPPDDDSLDLASQAGLKVHDASSLSDIYDILSATDLVHFHFWNTPEFYALLSRPLPPMRSVTWCHVNGQHPPHIVTRELLETSDTFVACSPITLGLDLVKSLVREKAELIFDGADFARLDGFRAENHETFNVGYIGTIDFAKMHPDFVSMNAAANIEDARFILCGRGKAVGAIKNQIAELKEEVRFQLLGYVTDICSVIAQLDVFGYPLCEDNYSAGELVLQEVMYAGVPPVVLPFGGAPHLVTHGESGLIVKDGKEYTRAIEFLYRNPDERARLGHNAAARARQSFGARNSAGKFNAIYARLLQRPKSVFSSRDNVKTGGADLFVRSLGCTAVDFRTSLTAAVDGETLAAEKRISSVTPAVGDCIIEYRNHFTRDRYLALWSGLVLASRKRPALAVAEFKRAIELGCDHWRAQLYLARAAQAAGSNVVAETALAAVRAAAPQFMLGAL